MVLDNIQTDLETLAKSPPGTRAGASLLIPILKPVGHQSTNLLRVGAMKGEFVESKVPTLHVHMKLTG